MPIGKVKVTYSEGSLGLTIPTNDSVAALICYRASKQGTMNQDQVYPIKRLKNLTDLGVTRANSQYVWDEVSNYYKAGNNGKTLYVVATAKDLSTLVSLDANDKPNAPIFKSITENLNLLATSKNTINFIGFALQNKQDVTADKATVLSKTLMDNLEKANKVANALADQGNPMNFVFAAPSWSGAVDNTMPDWRGSSGKKKDYNRLSILLARMDKQLSSVGCVIGRLSVNPVQRKISRVRDGAIIPTDESWGFVDGTSIQSKQAYWDDINDKGYIFPIQYRGKDGYYFNDDMTLTPETNDRKFISLNRVVDKATLLTHALYQEELGDELETDPTTGKMSASTAAYLKTVVEQELTDKMVNSQEAIAVRAQVDADQDVSTGTVNIDLSIVPYGYYKSINISLGLTKTV